MSHLTNLPSELILQILTDLPIPDLLSLSRTSRPLRTLSLDPILHTHRLHSASLTLSSYLPHRPSLESLRPPQNTIYLTRTHLLARAISRSLITIRLNRNLAQRPGPNELVGRGILHKEYVGYDSRVSPALIDKRQRLVRERVRDWLGGKLRRRPSGGELVEMNILPEECWVRRKREEGGSGLLLVAPGLVERRRRVIRERLKDELRVWVRRRAALMRVRREEGREERVGVKGLVRRFTRKMMLEVEEDETSARAMGLARQKREAQAKWGREVEVARRREERRRGMSGGGCSQPTRAHVLGLRRFWEGVIKTAAT